MRIHPFSRTEYSDKDEGKELKKYRFVVNCTSYLCTKTSEYSTVIKTNATKRDILCPDCQSALYTERVEIK